jgi:CDP-4-dehydro-6-deoxyglucose reductase, E3
MSRQSFDVTVEALVRHGEVTLLTLQPAVGTDFAWRPGQYLSLLMPGGLRRSFSMAAPHRPGGAIELHIRRHSGGLFSDRLLSALAVGDRLTVDGPYGDLDWRDGGGPIVLLGTGTGLAPLKALIEYGIASSTRRPMRLYWGADTIEELYLAPALHSWAAECRNFEFVPVLASPHLGWHGRTGYVQDAAVSDLPHLHDTHVYACGSPRMIASARKALSVLSGWDEERFLTDPFEVAARAPAPLEHRTLTLVVQFKGERRSVAAAPGSSLLAALQSAGAPILSICGGKASCGECRVSIDAAWSSRLKSPARTERRLLAHLDGIAPGDRLACQILLTSEDNGLAVRLGS